MHKKILILASFIGAATVALGAFGAHGLKSLASEKAIMNFETAVRYQFYHTIAIFITGILYQNFKSKFIIWSSYLFVAGVVFFSGSLYLFTFMDVIKQDAPKWIGPLTPLGGVLFIAGWIFIAVAMMQSNNKIKPNN